MSASPIEPQGAVPSYVPPHLRGQVWDFRNEPDGNISFAHPEAGNGLSPDMSRVKLTPEQYKKTFDRMERLADLRGAAAEQYAPLDHRPETSSRQWNNRIAGALRGAYDWGTSTQGKGVGTAGLLSALVGGVGGYMWGDHTGENKIGKALTMALLAGGLGAAGTALAQRGHNKREMWLRKTAALSCLPYPSLGVIIGGVVTAA